MDPIIKNPSHVSIFLPAPAGSVMGFASFFATHHRNMVRAIRDVAGDSPVLITGDFNARM
jgi:hypothetical protein